MTEWEDYISKSNQRYQKIMRRLYHLVFILLLVGLGISATIKLWPEKKAQDWYAAEDSSRSEYGYGDALTISCTGSEADAIIIQSSAGGIDITIDNATSDVLTFYPAEGEDIDIE